MNTPTLQPFDWYDKLATDPVVQLLQRFNSDPALTYSDPETLRLARKILSGILASIAPTNSPTDLMVRATLCQLLELETLHPSN